MAATLKPILTISDMQAQTIIDRVAPGRKLSHIVELLVGEISAVFEIELEGGPPAFVLKVYPEALHWKLQKEVMVARLLDGKLGVPTPRILLADDSKARIDLGFVVMDRLEGKSVLGLEPTLDRSDAHAIYAQMGRVLREIHAIAMDSFGYIGAEGVVTHFPTNRAYMLSQFERKLQASPSSRDDRSSHGSSRPMWSAALLCSTAVPGQVFATSTSTPATCSRRDATDRSISPASSIWRMPSPEIR